jgi:hypothetical protein
MDPEQQPDLAEIFQMKYDRVREEELCRRSSESLGVEQRGPGSVGQPKHARPPAQLRLAHDALRRGRCGPARQSAPRPGRSHERETSQPRFA